MGSASRANKRGKDRPKKVQTKKSVPSKFSPASAKITQPRLIENVYLRKSLFKGLDNALKMPVVWIYAPPGAGKTTLISTYLEQRKLPCIWYQIDEGDGDIASFFHYMGIAAKHVAPRYKKPLPHLTPEYLLGLPTFTRNYFRELYSRVSKSQSIKGSKRSDALTHGHSDTNSRFTIVLDNYQDAPADSSLHEIIQAGLSEIPEGINVIIISRTEPPSVFAGLRANNRMNIIGWDELELSSEETSGIVQLKVQKKLSAEIMQEFHDKTNGWAAGLVLMLERLRIEDISKVSVHGFKPQAMFDYFAREIFQKLDAASQVMLLQSVFLPIMTTSLIQQLTGLHQAGELLSELNRRNYFTIRKPLPEPVYQYHPLFREFLLTQARQQLTDTQLIQTQRKAAEILEGAGQAEDAIILYSQAGDWASMARIILASAQTMIEQGRSNTLEEWIRQLPQAVVDKTPWLLYWLGICRVPFNPTDARRMFEQAFSLFKADDDPIGTLLAWSELVLCISHESANFGEAALYFKAFDSLPEKLRTPLSLELEARVAVCMIIEANYLPQMRPDATAWADRLLDLIQTDININLRLQTAVDLFIYYMWRGLFTKAAVVMQLLNNAVKAYEATPFQLIMVKLSEAIYCWLISADAQASLQIVQDALALTERTGICIWDFHFLCHGLAAALTLADLPKAEDLLGRLTQLLPAARPLDKGYYYYLAAWYAFQKDDIQNAHTQLSLIKEMKDVLVVPFTKAIFFLTGAQVYHRLGDDTQALQDVQAALNEAREMNSRMLEFMTRITEAQIAMDLGNEADTVQSLRLGMVIGREEGLMNTFGWLPSVMSRLCTKALEHNIEADYVQMLIKKRGLIPPEGFISDLWPWQIKIYTLGRFGLLIDDKPIQSSKKAQKKPLEMLKVIISLGGREVKEEEITDLLWPEAEGDAGHKSFEITLIRLRRLIGNDKGIRLQEGLVSLDSRYCFVDVWNFERLIGKADALWNENKQTEAIQFSEKAINIYKGNYLKEERRPYTLSLRERLKGKFTRSLIRTGRYWEDVGGIKKAAELYQNGLEVDNLCEEIYQQLMLCCQKLGLKAEAMTAYHRCRNAMAAMLNTEPSARTKEIYLKIVN